MNRRYRPLVCGALAAGVAALAIPLGSTGSAHAAVTADGAKHAGATKAPFAGFNTSGNAEPIKIEVFEPTIPIPATPQVELDLGYSVVAANTASSAGRSSYVWPGDAVGEGFATIAGGLGLPLPSSVTDMGYPVQVNAAWPAGPASDTSDMIPGQVMDTNSRQSTTDATTTYSSTCSASSSDPGSSPSSSPSSGLPIGLPTGLPSGLPTALPTGLPLLGGLTHPQAAASSSPSASASPCAFPSQLAAVISVGGYTSTTHEYTRKSHITTVSRSALSDISLAGGLVTISGVTGRSSSTASGTKGTPEGTSEVGNLFIAGNQFEINSDGSITSVGTQLPVPGLPSAPGAALKMLGISFQLNKPVLTHKKASATSTVQGLQVTIDSGPLAKTVEQLPLGTIVDAIPFPASASMLKQLLQAATHLSPKFVIQLANANTSTQTVAAIPLPPIPTPSPSASTSPSTSSSPTSSPTSSAAAPPAPGGDNGTGPGSVAVPPGTSGDVPPATDVGSTPAPATTEATQQVAAGSRLPKLFSIPGLLFLLGIAGAGLFGAFGGKLGLAALGGTNSCPHGLDSGLPDLRKV